jgi:ABC-type nickel/cobalt efflux system permease component RcnA
VLGWLGVVSGLTVAAVGVGMLVDTRRRLRRHNATGATDHHDRADHDHADHDHADHGRADHDHAHGSHHHGGHDHSGHVHGGPGRLSIVGMGIAGGLVPSPSALIVLLGAIGLGRTGFGVLLVLAYGMGMAATLTAAGLALVVVRRRWAGRLAGAGNRWAKLARLVPTGTAMLVLLVGVGLAGRALAVIA